MDKNMINDPDFLNKLGLHIQQNIEKLQEYCNHYIGSSGSGYSDSSYFREPDNAMSAGLYKEEIWETHNSGGYSGHSDKIYIHEKEVAEMIADNPKILQDRSFYCKKLSTGYVVNAANVYSLAAESGFANLENYSHESQALVAMHICRNTNYVTTKASVLKTLDIELLNEENKRLVFNMARCLAKDSNSESNERLDAVNIMGNVISYHPKEERSYYHQKLYEMRTGGSQRENSEIRKYFDRLIYKGDDQEHFKAMSKRRFRPFSDPVKKILLSREKE